MILRHLIFFRTKKNSILRTLNEINKLSISKPKRNLLFTQSILGEKWYLVYFGVEEKGEAQDIISI